MPSAANNDGQQDTAEVEDQQVRVRVRNGAGEVLPGVRRQRARGHDGRHLRSVEGDADATSDRPHHDPGQARGPQLAEGATDPDARRQTGDRARQIGKQPGGDDHRRHRQACVSAQQRHAADGDRQHGQRHQRAVDIDPKTAAHCQLEQPGQHHGSGRRPGQSTGELGRARPLARRGQRPHRRLPPRLASCGAEAPSNAPPRRAPGGKERRSGRAPRLASAPDRPWRGWRGPPPGRLRGHS